LGRGGVTAVSRAMGLSRVTIHNGIRKLNAPPLAAGQVRRPGTGHRRLEAVAPDIMAKLESLIEPVSGGDLEAPLRWTCKSMRVMADELTAIGYPVSHEKVIQLLRGLGYNLQGGGGRRRKDQRTRTGPPSSGTSTSRSKTRWPKTFRWSR